MACLERQFRGYFEKADRQKGITGTNLLLFLERRLDNMVFRMGFANSRTEARQLVRHNHFLVNGKPVNIPSYLVNVGSEIQVREKSRKVERIRGGNGNSCQAWHTAMVGTGQRIILKVW